MARLDRLLEVSLVDPDVGWNGILIDRGNLSFGDLEFGGWRMLTQRRKGSGIK